MASIRVGILVLLAACTVSEKHYVAADAKQADSQADSRIDAPGPFACAGKPLPTTAPAQVTLSGFVNNPVNNQRLANVTIDVLDANNNVLGTTMTNATGDFSKTLATGGVPVSGHLRATLSGYMQTFVYPSRPIDADKAMLPIAMTTTAGMTTIAQLGGVTYDSAKAMFNVAVLDCDTNLVQGATITTNPQGTLRYSDMSGTPTAGLSATTSFGGAWVFNVTAGSVLITGQTMDGIQFRSVSVNALAGAWTVIGLQP